MAATASASPPVASRMVISSTAAPPRIATEQGARPSLHSRVSGNAATQPTPRHTNAPSHPRPSPPRAPRQAAAPRAGDAGASEVVGRGPDGEALYAGEWAREPTDAEIGGYWTHNRTGWGLVACKTMPNDRVDDCVELDQSPAGSHLASAVRQAAWQFRVRPPRKGGRALIGAWVRILIEIEERG